MTAEETKEKRFYQLFCPQCKKSTSWAGNPFRPFCSERCKLIDLGAWASESYRIPGDRTEDPILSSSEEE